MFNFKSAIILTLALLAASTSRSFAQSTSSPVPPVTPPTIIGGGSPQPIGTIVYVALIPVLLAIA